MRNCELACKSFARCFTRPPDNLGTPPFRQLARSKPFRPRTIPRPDRPAAAWTLLQNPPTSGRSPLQQTNHITESTGLPAEAALDPRRRQEDFSASSPPDSSAQPDVPTSRIGLSDQRRQTERRRAPWWERRKEGSPPFGHAATRERMPRDYRLHDALGHSECRSRTWTCSDLCHATTRLSSSLRRQKRRGRRRKQWRLEGGQGSLRDYSA